MRTMTPRKKPAPKDWHPADIIAALRKRRLSLRALSREHSYSDGSLRMALRRPWPKAEKIIAEGLGTKPWKIWPSRYDASGAPKRGVPANEARG